MINQWKIKRWWGGRMKKINNIKNLKGIITARTAMISQMKRICHGKLYILKLRQKGYVI